MNEKVESQMIIFFFMLLTTKIDLPVNRGALGRNSSSLFLLRKIFQSVLLHLASFYIFQSPWNLGTQLNCQSSRAKPSRVESSLMLRSTVSRPIYLGIKHESGAYDQIFTTVIQLRVCWCWALCLSVCRLQLLLVLLSAVIFGSESRGTFDHILLSQIRDFPFRRLLRLAGIQCRFSTPSLHRIELPDILELPYIAFARTTQKITLLLSE
jgi:hypothetical protein